MAVRIACFNPSYFYCIKILMQKIIVLLILLLISAGVIYAQPHPADTATVFVCPPCGSDCDNLVFAKAGTCPHCGMELVHKSKAEAHAVKDQPMNICFYLQQGVEVLDFAGPMEVFSYAGFHVFTVSKTKKPIVSQGILKIIPDYSINDAPPSDIIAFFGGNAGIASADDSVISWINARRPTTKYYFSVCTGAFILGKTGMLDKLTITTFHASIAGLQKAIPSAKVLPGVRFVDNGNIITTAGISAGIDGALHLVAKLKGEKAAAEVARQIEYDKWNSNDGLIINGKK
jgi:putative intracellular protease/amidase/predicted RNA-binding Zn-ribbon protein involved in translation (DUF1610 family)